MAVNLASFHRIRARYILVPLVGGLPGPRFKAFVLKFA